MGNYRFRLSDMIPNAWFYKLKDMSKGRKQYTSQAFKKKPPPGNVTSQKPNSSHQRYSYCFTTEPGRAEKFHYNSPVNPKASDTHFPDLPRKSSNKRNKRKTIYKPSPKLVSTFSADCSCRVTVNSNLTKSIPGDSPDYSSSPAESSYDELDFLSESDEDDGFLVPDTIDHQLSSWSSSCNCNVSSSTADIIIDMNEESYERKIKEVEGFGSIPELELPRILTKPAKFNDKATEVTQFRRSSSKLEGVKTHRSLSVKIVNEKSSRTLKEQKKNPPTRKSSANSTGIKLRANTPRIASRKIQACARKGVSFSRNKTLSESFAVVMSSVDPQRDFKDSMVEMIVENNIQDSKDLEDLLACYLSLNSRKYHDFIVKAFEQIWFDMTDLHL
ncbi:PREDICTED: transcription repressor OFP4 [Populus euphratica]|uniref:Transcription repressor n=1 Tax=Populus euphratica TaxID=75702 RepID=A0AAJ6Y440_POPEU|nr:PREDICTED: transcription repressor OFP4 [Populus euphratica]